MFLDGMGYAYGPDGPGNPGTYNLTAADGGAATILFAQYPEEITHIGFPYRSKTGTPVALQLMFDTPDSSGFPTGVDAGGGSPTATVFTPPNDTTWNNTFQWIELTNPYTPTRGEILLVTLTPSGTPDGSNYSTVALRFDSQFTMATLRNFPHVMYKTAGVWAKTGSASSGSAVAFRTANRHWGYPVATTINTSGPASTGHRVAKAFTLPTSVVSTFTILGAYISGRPAQAASKTVRVGIWNAAGTAIASRDFSSSITRELWSSSRPFMSVFDDATLPVLDGGTRYYIGLENVDSIPQLDYTPLSHADDRLCFPNGENIAYATWDGSSWTETDTLWPLVQCIYDEWTVPSGGGTLLTGLKRGIRL